MSSSSEAASDASDAVDTYEEIVAATRPASQKKKTKGRAVSPARFGAQLSALLATTVPTEAPFSLRAPPVVQQRQEQRAEKKAKKEQDGERKDKEERGRERDVIGAWGAESERALRKVAQRGVVKLFNAIQQAQAPTTTKSKTQGEMDEDSFMKLIKSGGTVSKV